MIKERYGLWEILKSIKVDFQIFKEDKNEVAHFFKDGDVFAFLLNNKLTKITLDLNTDSIKLSDGETENFVMHNLSHNDFRRLVSTVKDRSLLDLSEKGQQEKSFNPVFGSYIYPKKFKTVQDDNVITVELEDGQ